MDININRKSVGSYHTYNQRKVSVWFVVLCAVIAALPLVMAFMLNAELATQIVLN